MLFARNMRSLLLPVFALLLVLLFCAAGLSTAQDDINFTISVDPASLTAPGEVTVSVRIDNTGNADMTEPVALYDPAHSLVTSFGDGGSVLVEAGKFASSQVKWGVTQEQLDLGKIIYTIEYNVLDQDGNITVVSREAAAEIAFTGVRVTLDVKRTIDPPIARSAQTVTVLYELTNTGNVGLTDIKVRENSSISKTSQTIKTLAPGARETVKFTVKMGTTALKSTGNISYKEAGKTETLTQTLPEIQIPPAAPDLAVTLEASSPSVNIGDIVTMKLTMVNKGNISYSNVSVTDAKQGVVFTNLELPAGETLVKEKEFTLMEPATFLFSIALEDNTGTSSTLKTNSVQVSAYDPTQLLRLTLVLTSDRASIDSTPSEMRFTLVVTNDSDVAAKDIAIKHGEKLIYTIASLAPAQSMTVARDYMLSQAGKFRFTATTKDTLSNDVSFESNELQVSYIAPTAAPSLVPVITPAPLVTIKPPTVDEIDPALTKGRDILFLVLLGLGGVFILVFGLFAVSSVIRLRANSKSNGAYDHLELAARRDYTEPAVPSEPAEPAEGITQEIKEEDMPHAKYLEEETAAGVPEVSGEKKEEDVPVPEVTEEGGYRLTRSEEEAPSEEKRTRRATKRKPHTPGEDE